MPDRAETLRKLQVVRLICLVDLVMLVVLLYFSFSDTEAGVHVLGPIHGVVVLVLLYLTLVGAGEKRWPWWFAVTTLIPPVALVFEERMRRQLRAA